MKKITLTLEQKISAYEYTMRSLYANNNKSGMYVCFLLKMFINNETEYHRYVKTSKLKNIFTEFFTCMPKRLPDNGYGGWWSQDNVGLIIRLMACQWCIDQLNKENEKTKTYTVNGGGIRNN